MSIELKGIVNGLIAAVVSLAVVFGLSALLEPKPSVSTSRAPAATAAATGITVSSTLVLVGHSAYTQYCAGCHGDHGEGVMGPDVRNETMTDIQLTNIIVNGSKPMPAFKAKLTSDQIAGLVQYVRTLKK